MNDLRQYENEIESLPSSLGQHNKEGLKPFLDLQTLDSCSTRTVPFPYLTGNKVLPPVLLPPPAAAEMMKTEASTAACVPVEQPGRNVILVHVFF